MYLTKIYYKSLYKKKTIGLVFLTLIYLFLRRRGLICPGLASNLLGTQGLL